MSVQQSAKELSVHEAPEVLEKVESAKEIEEPAAVAEAPKETE